MKKSGIDDRESFVAFATSFDENENKYLDRAELKKAADAYLEREDVDVKPMEREILAENEEEDAEEEEAEEEVVEEEEVEDRGAGGAAGRRRAERRAAIEADERREERELQRARQRRRQTRRERGDSARDAILLVC